MTANAASPFSRNVPCEFKGEVLCSTDLGGILFHASRFCRGARIERHKHTTPYFCLLVGGPLSEHVGAHTWKHGPLTLLAHPPDEAHSDTFGGPGICVNIGVSQIWMRAFGADVLLPDRRSFDYGPMLSIGLGLLRLYTKWVDSPPTLDVEELAGELLTMGAKLPACELTSPLVSRVLEHLVDDPASSLRLSDYASLAQVHPVYLARVFRRTTGMSIGEYQRIARLRFAIQLLTGTCSPISHIAQASGFTDQSHLTHLLKRSTGFTPDCLRRACNETITQVRGIQDRQLVRR